MDAHNGSPIHYFTPKEITEGQNEINQRIVAEGICEHLLGAIVEYLQTSIKGIAHQFHIDSKEFIHPKDNLQYSLGGVHGMRHNVQCPMLPSSIDKPVHCKVLKTSCLSVKFCEFYNGSIPAIPSSSSHDAKREVFLKTFALFSVLHDKGCSFSTQEASIENPDASEEDTVEDVQDFIDGIRYHDVRAPQPGSTCKGKILLRIQYLARQHHALPKEEKYLRFAGSEGTFNRIFIDTSFKRARGWEEFEIETWEDIKMRSVTCSRVFISSQSAEAHRIMFEKIFELVHEDTGHHVQFKYIHGNDIETVVADAHKGQAMGKIM
ncbi:hypothetical protein M422DRAFT_277086 [Sphaerobolus stellatus SS14]|uniref:Uncharacterized protein n=1 Tax=Sphaerobolus stellatus (strain SS14) TaxID=990650 RepID=A0A0C9U0K1_SPHS4|nr:hypothetical protein M422DRAFT_277086 [Sphaerobolus stellatus SS14]